MESSGAGLPKQVLAVTEALCSTILSVRNGYSAYVLWVYWDNSPHGRARYYREHSDFLAGAVWSKSDVVFWCNADNKDTPDPEFNLPPELYNLNAVGYESIMLGLHQILL